MGVRGGFLQDKTTDSSADPAESNPLIIEGRELEGIVAEKLLQIETKHFKNPRT